MIFLCVCVFVWSGALLAASRKGFADGNDPEIRRQICKGFSCLRGV